MSLKKNRKTTCYILNNISLLQSIFNIFYLQGLFIWGKDNIENKTDEFVFII